MTFKEKLIQIVSAGALAIPLIYGLSRELDYLDYKDHVQVMETVHKEDPVKAYGIALNSLSHSSSSGLTPWDDARAFREYIESHPEDKANGESWAKAHSTQRYSSLFQCD